MCGTFHVLGHVTKTLYSALIKNKTFCFMRLMTDCSVVISKEAFRKRNITMSWTYTLEWGVTGRGL